MKWLVICLIILALLCVVDHAEHPQNVKHIEVQPANYEDLIRKADELIRIALKYLVIAGKI